MIPVLILALILTLISNWAYRVTIRQEDVATSLNKIRPKIL